MDTYQPIYDAVRSQIRNGDIGAAVEQAFRDANISHYAEMASRTVIDTVQEYVRPSVLWRPKLFRDGNKWCALYGENLEEGVAGFGNSPCDAMWDFDKAFATKLKEVAQ